MRTWRLVCVVLACALAPATALSMPKATQAYVGIYGHGTVDTRAQLALLDDGTFCYQLSAGELDMQAAGNWRVLPDKQVVLEEVRPAAPTFSVSTSPAADKGVSFELNGESLSDADDPVFGFSETEAEPTAFRPLFDPDPRHTWQRRYTLPSMPATKAQYLFIGHHVGRSQDQLQLEVYRIPVATDAGLLVRVGFGAARSGPPFNALGSVVDNVLQLDGEPFGTRKPLSATQTAELRKRCVQPVLHPQKPGASSGIAAPLAPLKTLTLSAGRMQGEPYFPAEKSHRGSRNPHPG